MILNLYKKEGETPLERIRRFTTENPEYKNKKMTYAGRLDPMAEGVLIILTDEDVHIKDNFLRLDKEYEFEVLWAVSSDTHDILGEVSVGSRAPSDENIEEDLGSWQGKIELPYPAYSSRSIKGKPLWVYAREDKLAELEVPKKTMNIIDIKFYDSKEVKGDILLNYVKKRIETVAGDFRQHQVIDSWQRGLKETNANDFKISRFKAVVASGTYIRSLVVRMGEKYHTKALAWSIKRTKVGNYQMTDSVV